MPPQAALVPTGPGLPLAPGLLALTGRQTPWRYTLTGSEQRGQGGAVDPQPPSPPALAGRWFAEFVQQHEPALRATALRLCAGNPADARDLVQDTLERGLRNAHRYQQGTDGRAWLTTILHRLFIDRCRSRAREQRADVSAEELADSLPVPEEPQGPSWATVTTEQLHEALEQLPVEFREVYRLHALEGRSYDEIAARLGVAKNTVGTRLLRARRRLKELLLPQRPQQGESV